MKRPYAIAGLALLVIVILAYVLLAGMLPDHAPAALSATLSPPPGMIGVLPGRATPDSSHTPALVLNLPGTPAPTLIVTSPFTFPTTPPEEFPTPPRACTSVFPLENIEAITFGQTTITQLEAAFGQAVYHGGRPTRFRFEQDGCILLITVGVQEAQEAELIAYGTLGLLLDHYGPPAAAGSAQGNLTLPLAGSTVLLYPPQGIIAIFEEPPGELTRQTTVSTLQFRPPYDLEKQLTRLNVQRIEWAAPLR